MASYLTELDLDPEATRSVLSRARALKQERAEGGEHGRPLAGRSVALYFEKPSVRTRVSFTVGVQELGGHVVELSRANTKVGEGEHPEDFAAVLGRLVHMIVARVFDQSMLSTFVQRSGVSVINALSDERHPCQALADALTIMERRGSVEGAVFAFIGEGNNVAASTGLLLAALGAQVRIASPEGYGLPEAQIAESAPLAGSLVQLVSPAEAADGADVLYTDTWVSMGQEADKVARAASFEGYRIDRALLARASPDAMVMHCLPAVRGQEIDAELMYDPCSAIWDQAENRLHAQKALMLHLFDR